MPRTPTAIVDQDLLSDEELKALHKQAEDEYLKDRKAEAKKLLLKQFKQDARSKNEPAEEMVEYAVVLPRFAAFVSMDGVQYPHSESRFFPRKQCDSLRDIISNAWKHEEAAFGARDPNAFIRQQNRTIGPQTNVNLTGHFMRV